MLRTAAWMSALSSGTRRSPHTALPWGNAPLPVPGALASSRAGPQSVRFDIRPGWIGVCTVWTIVAKTLSLDRLRPHETRTACAALSGKPVASLNTALGEQEYSDRAATDSMKIERVVCSSSVLLMYGIKAAVSDSVAREIELNEARIDCINCGGPTVEIESEADLEYSQFNAQCTECGEAGVLIITPGWSAIETGNFRLHERAVGVDRMDGLEHDDGVEVL